MVDDYLSNNLFSSKPPICNYSVFIENISSIHQTRWSGIQSKCETVKFHVTLWKKEGEVGEIFLSLLCATNFFSIRL